MKPLKLFAAGMMSAISAAAFADASDFTRVMDNDRKAGPARVACVTLASSPQDFRSEFQHLMLLSATDNAAAGNGCAVNGNSHSVSVSNNLFSERPESAQLYVGEIARFSTER